MSEIDRINFLVAFFGSNQCLSLQLAQYFSDPNAVAACGSCSVCLGQVAQLPEQKELQQIDTYDFDAISADAISKLKTNYSAVLLTRFFCGLTTPLFTKLKMRQTYGFAKFEHYRFKDVLNWVKQHKEK